jgi:hypothetical protein
MNNPISGDLLNDWLSAWPHALSHGPFVLGASSHSAAPMSDIFIYGGLIVAGIITLIYIALKARHLLLDDDAGSDAGDFFSIIQLRQLRDDGLLSEEEYERAKRVLVAQGLAMLNNSQAEK